MYRQDLIHRGVAVSLDSATQPHSTRHSRFEVPVHQLRDRLPTLSDNVSLVLDTVKISGFQTVPREVIHYETQLDVDAPQQQGTLTIPNGCYTNVWDYVNVINQIVQELFHFAKFNDVDGPKLLLKATRKVQHRVFKVRFSRTLWEKLGFVAPQRNLAEVEVSLLSMNQTCPLPQGASVGATTQDLTIRIDRSLPEATTGGPNIVKAVSKPDLLVALGELTIIIREQSPTDGNVNHAVLTTVPLSTDFWSNISPNKVVALNGIFDDRVCTLPLRHESVYEFEIQDAKGQPLLLVEGFANIKLGLFLAS